MKHRAFLILGLALAALLLVASAAFAQDAAPTVAPTPLGNTAAGSAPVVNPSGADAGNNANGSNAVIGNTANNQTIQSGQGTFADEPIITEAVLPSALNRISWGAIIAGVIMALMIQLLLNLLGIGFGADKINPAEPDEDSATPAELGRDAAIWIGASTFIALFIGGYVAARFAGLPEESDGILHGLLTWAIVMLLTFYLVTTKLANLAGSVWHTLGSMIGALGQGAATVTQGAANVAASAARTATDVAADAARTAKNAAEDVADSVAPNTPMTSPAMNGSPLDQIKREAETLMRQGGIQPEALKSGVQVAAQDVQHTAGNIARNPANAEEEINDLIYRLFSAAQSATQQADRDALINALMARTHMPRSEAEQTVNRWQQNIEQARTQAENTVQDVKQQADAKIQDMKTQVNQTKREAEYKARQAGQKTADAISKAAIAIFAAMLIGAFSAGIGGFVGAPDHLPVVQIDRDAGQ
jgi:hypothetical protein